MQPESSKDPGGISIQKLKEACELVTITKQRRHIFLTETKRTLQRGFTSNKVRLSGLRPEPFQLHWPHCLPGLRGRWAFGSNEFARKCNLSLRASSHIA